MNRLAGKSTRELQAARFWSTAIEPGDRILRSLGQLHSEGDSAGVIE